MSVSRVIVSDPSNTPGGSRSFRSLGSAGGSASTGATGIRSPTDTLPGKDISLEEMLGSPRDQVVHRLEKDASWKANGQVWSEEAAESLNLATLEDGKSESVTLEVNELIK